MGRTVCTEPQCLYKSALYLTTFTLPERYDIFVNCNRVCHPVKEGDKQKELQNEGIQKYSPEAQRMKEDRRIREG
jgi:hypothetical protein